jgi:hypothetical protein
MSYRGSSNVRSLSSRWRRSSRSYEDGNCIEVRLVGSSVEVRDSKNPAGPKLRVSSRQWARLIEAIVCGRL